MNRMILSGIAVLMASAAFASPAQAQDIDLDQIDMMAPCWAYKPVTECVRDAANNVIDRINDIGPIIGNACEVVFPDCALLGEE